MRSRFRARIGAAALAATALAGCGGVETASELATTPTSFSTSTPTPLPILLPTPTPTPRPTPTASPVPARHSSGDVTTNAGASRALSVERRLAALGYPTGTVDGVVSVRTRQALCAWRDLHGLSSSRAGLGPVLAGSILSASDSRWVSRANGLYINKTCQVLIQVVNHRYRRIVWVSTAMPGYTTPSGTGRVWRKWAGAHESSLYSDAWMYDSIYFRRDHPGIAMHGSATNSLVHSYPASHGCVRVWRPTIHSIFNETPIGTRVVVYGSY